MAKNDELRIRNFSPQLKRDLQVVAANVGVPMAYIAKLAIRKVVDEHLKAQGLK
jgi:hypothetical protein